MGRELERKFRATPELIAKLRNDWGPFTSISMETTYYDTPENTLSARRITLRCRKENERSVCTVKTPEGKDARGEWETEGEEILQAIPKLCKLGAPEELRFIKQVTAVCGARFLRQARTVALPECVGELALDCGVLLGGGREAQLCEVEWELKSGKEEAFFAFAQQLAQRYGLQEEPKSKFSRALALAKGE